MDGSSGYVANDVFIPGYALAGCAAAETSTWAKDCVLWLAANDAPSYYGKSLGVLTLLVLTGEMRINMISSVSNWERY
jgi:hypothetical protein